MITSKEIASLAHVSVSTVSRAFSCPEKLKKKTVEKILRIAEENHYIPNANARSLKKQCSNIFGFVISDINNPFYIRVVNAFSEFTDKKFHIAFSKEDSQLEYSAISSLISSRIDGLCFTPTSNAYAEIPALLKDNDIVALQLYRKKFGNIDSLLINDKYGALLATNELLEHGHRNILLFDYDLLIPTHRDEGFIQAYQELKLDPKSGRVVKLHFNDNIETEVFNALESFKPTAVITTGSLITTLVCQYLTNHNLRIKEDMSIIAYDDVDVSQSMNITAISHPIKEIAETASQMLTHRISNRNSPIQSKLLNPFIIKRNSVKNLNE